MALNQTLLPAPIVTWPTIVALSAINTVESICGKIPCTALIIGIIYKPSCLDKRNISMIGFLAFAIKSSDKLISGNSYFKQL